MSNAQFRRDYAAIIKRADDKAHLVVRKSAIAIGKGLVEKSPVGNPDLWKSDAPEGYVGGRFRNNWQYGAVSLNADTGSPIDESGSGAISRIVAGVAEWTPGQTIFMTNSLPYSYRLEHGWSQQAPQGMVKLTVMDFQRSVRNAVESIR